MTYRASRCLACGHADLQFRAAIVAPFIAARVFQSRSSVCRLAGCKRCGFAFFEDRFDDTEMTALYAGYRDSDYVKTRHYWEPWYSAKFNSECGGEREMVERRRVYADTIQECAPGEIIDTVLDYGGDRGQMMLGGPGRKHHVFDISGVEAEPGVVRIMGKSSLGVATFDLVLLCEVLEHVSDPMQVLRDVQQHVRLGGLLYVTVPNREFSSRDIPAGPLYSAYLRLILKNRWATMLADFWSTGFRILFRRIPPFGFAKLHEHVSFFNSASLTELLRRAELTILSCRPYQRGRGLVALCRRKPAQGQTKASCLE